MALTVSADGAGAYAAVECDRPGCFSHVTIRPAEDGWTLRDLAETAAAYAEDDGWWLQGESYCPRHGQRRASRALGRLAERFQWVRTHSEPVKH